MDCESSIGRTQLRVSPSLGRTGERPETSPTFDRWSPGVRRNRNTNSPWTFPPDGESWYHQTISKSAAASSLSWTPAVRSKD